MYEFLNTVDIDFLRPNSPLVKMLNSQKYLQGDILFDDHVNVISNAVI